VYYTVTDKDGDQISFYVEGYSVPDKTGKFVLTGATAIVIEMADYHTTGKYTTMVDAEFIDEGFITDFSDQADTYTQNCTQWIHLNQPDIQYLPFFIQILSEPKHN